MERAHGEHGHLPGGELGADDALVPVGVDYAGFRDGLGEDAAGDDDEELRGAGVEVEGDHSAGCFSGLVFVSERVGGAMVFCGIGRTWDFCKSHASSGANEGREGLGISEPCAVRLVEIKDEVFVIGEELVSIDGAGYIVRY